MTAPTNKEVFDNGFVLDSWMSDEGGSNQSNDLVIDYQDKVYLVTIDSETDEPIHPKRLAIIYDNN
jgi:hypothetical protein